MDDLAEVAAEDAAARHDPAAPAPVAGPAILDAVAAAVIAVGVTGGAIASVDVAIGDESIGRVRRWAEATRPVRKVSDDLQRVEKQSSGRGDLSRRSLSADEWRGVEILCYPVDVYNLEAIK